MAFPSTPLAVKVELQLGGVWTDVTSYAYLRDRINIARGRSDENSRAQPGTCRVTLNNRDGRFSPRNPSGPYYGLLTRNTPIRVSAAVGAPALLAATALDFFNTPDTAGLSITGDIDLRVDASIDGWDFVPGPTLLRKFNTAGNQRSYRLGSTNGSGNLFLGWSADGITEILVQSTVGLPQTTGRQTIRGTLDVDNGAGGNTVTFYYGPSVAGPWTQLGSPVVTAGITSIFDSTADVQVGFTSSVVVENGVRVYAAEIRQGIAGTARANPDFTAQTSGASSFADAAGNTWTAQAGAVISDRRYRFHGEVSSWPQAWDLSQQDVWVTISAAGILRRLGQGTKSLAGPIQRAVLRNDPASAVGYWPMEDSIGATSIASGLAGGPSMSIEGTPNLAASEIFAASAPLPEMAQAAFSGPVNAYTATGAINAYFLLYVPPAGDVDQSVLMRIFTTGTAAYWDVVYATSGGGGLNLIAYDSSGATILSTGAGFAVNGKPLVLILELVQNGANIDWFLRTRGLTSGIGLVFSGTLNTRTVGAAVYIQSNQTRSLVETVIGHLTVRSAVQANVELFLRGYSGETAGRRIERLCTEEGVPFIAYGSLDDSVAMGAQQPNQLLDLLAEAELADLGQLFESRDQLGLAYRPRSSRALQPPVLALTYGNLRELDPVEDDQATRNDVTVTRIGGSSARATVDVGPLSTQAPPNGVGRYDDSIELSLATDAQCANQASLRVTIGTIDEPRYPVIGVHLETAAFAASPALTSQALDLDCGDRITVSGTPVWLPPGLIDQHAIGTTESIGIYDYQIGYVCQPATPIGSADVYDASTFRWAADGSTLNASMTTTATSVTVATTAGKPLWTTTDTPLTIIVAGEEITVGVISGASSPQTFSSLTRSVNGVVKAHSSGEAVQIADPVYYAL